MRLTLPLETWLRPRSELGLVPRANELHSVIKVITCEVILQFLDTVICSGYFDNLFPKYMLVVKMQLAVK